MALSPSVQSGQTILVSSPAVAEWLDHDDVKYLGCHSQHRLTFEVQIDAPTYHAALMLRIPLSLKEFANKKFVYSIIPPDNLRSLRVDSNGNDISERVRDVFAKGKRPITIIHFSVDRPAMIVGPPEGSGRLRSSSSEEALRALHSLSSLTEFTLHVLSESMGEAQLKHLLSLCGGPFRLGPNHVQSLYAGKGGKLLCRTEEQSHHAESPPSYDELALTPPPPAGGHASTSTPEAPPGKKRKAPASPGDSITDQQRSLIEQQFDVFGKRLEEHLNKQWERKLDDRLMEVRESILSEVDDHLERQLAEIRVEILDTAYDWIEEGKKETDDVLTEQLDDRLLDIKEEVRDTVKEELEMAEENIRADLRHALG
ncbi:hypothetical protein B0J12DRAFT_777163 [Macrophomina phaseolina]|uniref:Uncharacterized protein n=1 Tax=Macrophomina phaseolina TaxID=35725 RepID=A0ABQ8FTS0_9PEZI|nr:hypothetical protein B0J12DRAFT_777163 [Macrophomina phaseolina]